MPEVVRRELRLPDGRGGTVSGVLLAHRKTRPGVPVLLSHGAGGNLHTPVLVSVAKRLAEAGHSCLRHNFPYAEAGRKRPDFPRYLQGTILHAAQRLCEEARSARLVLGGKSLGGRMASVVLSEGALEAHGLLLLGYPLHPPGRREELRDAHLSRIGCPILFVQGTRDPFADFALVERTVDRLRLGGHDVTLHVVEGGEHSFKLPVRMGRAYEAVVDEVASVVERWVGALPR